MRDQRRADPKTSGIAERAVRRVKEGTSSVLVQSGLQVSWWAVAMECCCYLRNVQALIADGQTLCERRFQFTSRWADHSIWSMIKLLSNVIRRPRSSAHQFGTKVLPGILIGYALNVGEGGLVSFCGGYQEYANNSTFEIHVKGFKSKGVEILKRNRGNLYSHAQRAKSCQRNSRYLPLFFKR